MAGTLEGGKKAAAKNKQRFGPDFYREIGRKGGAKKTTQPKGFAANRQLAADAGRIGGKASKRKKNDEPVDGSSPVADDSILRS